MNKNLKSLPLLVFALCVAVQQSDSAVSAVLLLSFPAFPQLFFCTCCAQPDMNTKNQGDSVPAEHHWLFQHRFINRGATSVFFFVFLQVRILVL